MMFAVLPNGLPTRTRCALLDMHPSGKAHARHPGGVTGLPTCACRHLRESCDVHWPFVSANQGREGTGYGRNLRAFCSLSHHLAP